MSNTALSAAHHNVLRKFDSLCRVWADIADVLPPGHLGRDPDAALRLAYALEERAESFGIGIRILKSEAQKEINARKGVRNGL